MSTTNHQAGEKNSEPHRIVPINAAPTEEAHRKVFRAEQQAGERTHFTDNSRTFEICQCGKAHQMMSTEIKTEQAGAKPSDNLRLASAIWGPDSPEAKAMELAETKAQS